MERIFRYIAVRIDEDLPNGSNWHLQLLQRMETSIETVRPAVLDRVTARQLDQYLRFRHLFRNLYGSDLDWERCQKLLKDLPAAFEKLVQQLATFDEFLHTLEHKV